MLTGKGLLGLLAAAMGGLTCLLAASIQSIPGEAGISPGAFPMLLGILLTALGLLLFVSAWRRPAPQDSMALVRLRILGGRGPALSALFLLYCVAFEYLPFLPGALIFLALGMLALGERNLRRLILAAAIGAGSLFLLFRYVFSVFLP